MDMNKLLEDAKDEPAGVAARSADGRLFFIPNGEAERFAVEDSDMYERLIASRGSAPVANADSLYPCVLARDCLDSHKVSAKWRRICTSILTIAFDLSLAERTVAMRKAEPAKLPGKKTPPTLILKRSKDGGTELGPIPRSVPEAKIPKK
jgi:hypothetical protein